MFRGCVVKLAPAVNLDAAFGVSQGPKNLEFFGRENIGFPFRFP
jgi:hypothetical protein